MEDENRFMTGLINGILLALPLWGILLSVVTLLLH